MPSLVSHSLPSTLGRLLHEDSLCITWINSTGVLSPLWNHILRHLSDSLIPSRLPNTIQALHFLNQNQDLSDFAPFTCYHPMTHPSVSSPSSIVLLNFFLKMGSLNSRVFFFESVEPWLVDLQHHDTVRAGAFLACSLDILRNRVRLIASRNHSWETHKYSS